MPTSLEELVSPDLFYRRLEERLDLSFVRELVRPPATIQSAVECVTTSEAKSAVSAAPGSLPTAIKRSE